MRAPTLLTAALAIALLLPSGTQADSTPDPGLNRALERITGARGGPPGALMLVQRGRQSEIYRAGVRRLGQRRPPGPRDHFRIASVSKAFNGAVTLRLASLGRLALTESLATGLPGALPLAGPVTLGQMLQHVGGLPEYIESEAFLERLNSDPTGRFAPAELLTYVRDEPLEFRPGSRYRYSDTDNIAAALIAARASGQSYEQLLRRIVLRPLGLRETSLPQTEVMPRPYLHGYQLNPNTHQEDVSQALNPSGAWASGGIVSTPADLNRFIRAYVAGRFTDAASRRAQFRFRPGTSSPPGPGRNQAGMAIFRYRTGCGTVFGHTGSFPGYRVFAAASPDGRRSVVFVASAQIVPGSGPERISNAMRRVQARAVCRALR